MVIKAEDDSNEVEGGINASQHAEQVTKHAQQHRQFFVGKFVMAEDDSNEVAGIDGSWHAEQVTKCAQQCRQFIVEQKPCSAGCVKIDGRAVEHMET